MIALRNFIFALSASTALCAVTAQAAIVAPAPKTPQAATAAPAAKPAVAAPAAKAAPVAPAKKAVLAMPDIATLSDTVTRALQTHPQIRASAEAREQAENTVTEQRAGFFPVLGVDGQVGHETNNDLDTRALTSDGGAADSWYGNGTVTLTQPLFSGLGTVNRVSGAKDRYVAAKYDLAGTEEDVALRAVRAHLNLMRTKELLALASQFITDIDARQKNIVLMVKEGAADEAEMLQANEIQAAAKNTRLSYEEAYRQAEADYIEVTGAAPGASLNLGAANWDAVLPQTLDGAVTSAFKTSPRILAADKMTSALNDEAQAEKSSLSPRLDAAVSYMKQDQHDVVGGESSSARAMLKLGWNFSTGGAELARIDKAKHQQSEALAKREGVMRNVEYGVRQKFTAMQIADQQFELLTQRETASHKILDNFTAQFEGGKQTNLQLIAANSRLFESQAARTDAYYRKVLARLELLNAMGRLRDAFEAPKAAMTGTSTKG